MFAPTKIWRKWHVKVNLNQKRFATVSAVAATALPSLVLARGHRIESVSEIPLVVSNSIESITKTKAAVAALQGLHAHADVSKVIASKKIRAGKGKARGRKHRQRRGPLIVYSEDNGIVKAFRNIPGVETSNVRSLNLLQLAPGGHLGRFVIWTEGAFALLDEVFGTYEKGSSLKANYKCAFSFLASKRIFADSHLRSLPISKITNPDVTRIINSDEIQAVVRAAGSQITKRPFSQKKNPLKNRAVLFRLNPCTSCPPLARSRTPALTELSFCRRQGADPLPGCRRAEAQGWHRQAWRQEAAPRQGRRGVHLEPPLCLSARAVGSPVALCYDMVTFSVTAPGTERRPPVPARDRPSVLVRSPGDWGLDGPVGGVRKSCDLTVGA